MLGAKSSKILPSLVRLPRALLIGWLVPLGGVPSGALQSTEDGVNAYSAYNVRDWKASDELCQLWIQ